MIAVERSLQWGHGCAAVVAIVKHYRSGKHCCFNGATAAQPWWRAIETTKSTKPISFNGATAGSRGGRAAGIAAVRSGRRFNGATAAQPWWRCCRSQPSSSLYRFNGATAAQPWWHTLISCTANEVLASMGPRLRSRGGVGSLSCSRQLSIGFNGATAAQPWWREAG